MEVPSTTLFGNPILIVIVAVILVVVFVWMIQSAMKNYVDSIPPEPKPLPVNSTAHEIANDIMDVISLEPREEVFNISENIYRYEDAAPVCGAFGAKLATVQQVHEAYKRGADWCNYGWVQGEMAVYPTQKTTWDKLQAGSTEQRNNCGLPGVNGGKFSPQLRFGVNCYGIKPPEKAHDRDTAANPVRSSEEIEFDKHVAEYKAKLGSIGILPFQKNSWTQ